MALTVDTGKSFILVVRIPTFIVLAASLVTAKSAPDESADAARNVGHAVFPQWQVANTQYRTIVSTNTGFEYGLVIGMPKNYDRKAKTKYPVVYILDGQSLFTFVHELTEFDEPTLKRKSLPACLMVGISFWSEGKDFQTMWNRRSLDFTPTHVPPEKLSEGVRAMVQGFSGGGEKFLAFVRNEVMTLIEREFSTSGDNTIVGYSAGGLLASYTMVQHPNLFQRAVIVSPALFWDNKLLLRLQERCSSTYAGRIFVSYGTGEDAAAAGYDSWKQFVDGMQRIFRGNVKADAFEGEGHNSVLPLALLKGLRWAMEPLVEVKSDSPGPAAR
jgi:predicted alpha/beta superfamily hydrolase